jgi:hypothetical protein
MIFIYYKDLKSLKIAQFCALAGQIQHMAAQKVRFTPRLLKQVVTLFCRFAGFKLNCFGIHISELSLKPAN